MRPLEHLDRPLSVGDVKSNPLQELRNAPLIADQLTFAMHPYDVPVTSQQPILRAEVDSRGAGLCKLGAPPLAVIRMDPVVPEERIVEPLLLGKPQQLLDLRADVKFRLRSVERGEKRDGWNLLDQRDIAAPRFADACRPARPSQSRAARLTAQPPALSRRSNRSSP